jgi:hypothetical protein
LELHFASLKSGLELRLCFWETKMFLCNHLLGFSRVYFLLYFFFILCTLFFLQIEPISSGNLPPSFDPSTWHSVWILLGIFFNFQFLLSEMCTILLYNSLVQYFLKSLVSYIITRRGRPRVKQGGELTASILKNGAFRLKFC